MIADVPTSERERGEIREGIARAFGDREPLASAYADYLSTAGIERGMIGPREAERIWERHLLNCAAIAPLIFAGATVIDLGSGAGLPGIPLAIARPDLTVVLLEPMLRRVRFLTDCLDALHLGPAVVIHHGRAEDGIAEPADVVVARAVAPFEKLMGLSVPLLKDNGTLLALKGESAQRELDSVDRSIVVEAEVLSMPAPGQPAIVVKAVPRRAVASPARRRGRR